MKTFVFALVTGGLVCLVESASVQAQGDHLLCYKMVDPLQIQAAADLIADRQPDFTQKGCRLKKPFQFCVPASKENVQGAPATATSFTGQTLKDDYVCYLISCPEQPLPPGKNVTDQFGLRQEKNYKPLMACVPASKAPVECGGSGAACGGACPPGMKCARGANGCGCQSVTTCGGTPDKNGMCGGDCPAPEVCQKTQSSTGKISCGCGPAPSPCGFDSAGVCGGGCTDATQQCRVTAGECKCQDVPQDCASSAPQCGGGCPSPDDVCLPSTAGANVCTCQPRPCGLVAATLAASQCGGACPPGQTCSFIAGVQPPCQCQPSPCGRVTDAAGNVSCGGTCDDSAAVCQVDAANNCTCLKPCEATTAPACGGSCPAGSKCQPASLTNPSCACVAG